MSEIIVSCLAYKLSTFKCKSIWCRIYTDKSNEDYITVEVCYSSSNAVDTEIDALFSSMREISEGSNPILIMGDFNYVGID